MLYYFAAGSLHYFDPAAYIQAPKGAYSFLRGWRDSDAAGSLVVQVAQTYGVRVHILAAGEILANATSKDIAQLVTLFSTDSRVPPDYDGKLIARAASYAGRKFTGDEMRKIRGIFIQRVRERRTL